MRLVPCLILALALGGCATLRPHVGADVTPPADKSGFGVALEDADGTALGSVGGWVHLNAPALVAACVEAVKGLVPTGVLGFATEKKPETTPAE